MAGVVRRLAVARPPRIREPIPGLRDQHQFAAVLNCAGNCALRACELDPALAAYAKEIGAEKVLAAISAVK